MGASTQSTAESASKEATPEAPSDSRQESEEPSMMRFVVDKAKEAMLSSSAPSLTGMAGDAVTRTTDTLRGMMESTEGVARQAMEHAKDQVGGLGETAGQMATEARLGGQKVMQTANDLAMKVVPVEDLSGSEARNLSNKTNKVDTSSEAPSEPLETSFRLSHGYPEATAPVPGDSSAAPPEVKVEITTKGKPEAAMTTMSADVESKEETSS